MIYIFDVDGTLTPSRNPMDKEFKDFFKKFIKKKRVWLISGSDKDKTIEQVGEDIWTNVERVYQSSGNQLWVKGELKYQYEFKTEDYLKELLEMFCTARLQARSPEEIITGKPWSEEGYTYFKLSALQEFLKRHNFTIYTRGQITERLKEMNSGGTADKQFRFKDNKDKWQSVRCWFITEIKKGEVDLPAVTFKNDEEPPF